jgi:5-methylcytosine-specific restriction enzyme A
MRRVPEWRGKTPDATIPARVKLRIFERDRGRCQNCTRQVGPGREPFEIDHKVAIANGGEHREANIQLLCSHCHREKTKADVALKSANYKKRLKNVGIKTKRHVIPGSRDSKFRKKIDGTVEFR